ncbi:MAG: methyltransferase [Cyclobacteriaceae bacterium]|nr:methyltransferase [Cyclobacteriaceae bacterium HetDA_MAG_MS6]
MKVTTEGCVFGAWISVDGVSDVLDIGTGTGLLALMVAQRAGATIDAVELDGEAARQAAENVSSSLWANNINVYHGAIQQFKTHRRYNLIVSNPPFFEGHRKPTDLRKGKAMHNDFLHQEDLLKEVRRLLRDDGIFYVLYPPAEASTFIQKMENSGLSLRRKLTIFNKGNGHPFRLAMAFDYRGDDCIEEELIIRDQLGQYTESFAQLLKPYYLHL